MAAASGCLSFSCPSTQQHLLVWKTKPSWWVNLSSAVHISQHKPLGIPPPISSMTPVYVNHGLVLCHTIQHAICMPTWHNTVCYMSPNACSVMVLKKLGDELTGEFHKVVEYLGHEQSMQVVVEPHEHEKMVCLPSHCFCTRVSRQLLRHALYHSKHLFMCSCQL